MSFLFLKMLGQSKLHKCLSCGANPTSHLLSWFEQSFSVFISPVDRMIWGNFFLRRVWRWVEKYGGTIALKVLLLFRVARYYELLEAPKSSRAKALWEEAMRRGILMRSVRLLGREIDCYEAKIHNTPLLFKGLPRPALYTGALWWADDKKFLKERLSQHNFSIPMGGCFSSWGSLRKAFEEIRKPVVIKPRLGSRGRHTTTFIYTKEDLKKAYRSAKQLCFWVIMEEHLTGPVYRATVIGGKTVGILGGSPPQVTGDGLRSIRELTAIKNRQKPEGVSDIVVSPLTAEFLRRIGCTPETILPKGKIIDVSEKIGVSYGGTSFEVTAEAHPEIKTIFERAAHIVGDPLLGFDFIIPDIAKSPHEQRWGIIECNTVPFINLHHYPLIGKPNNVAKYVWDLLSPTI